MIDIGDVIVQETNGTGILLIILSNGGNGLKFPVLTITSSSGSGGKIRAFGNGIGKVNGLKAVEHGKNTKLHNIKFFQNFLVVDITGSFVAGDTQLQAFSGNVIV